MKIETPVPAAVRRQDSLLGCMALLVLTIGGPVYVMLLLGSLAAVRWLWGVLISG